MLGDPLLQAWEQVDIHTGATHGVTCQRIADGPQATQKKGPSPTTQGPISATPRGSVDRNLKPPSTPLPSDSLISSW